MSRSIYLVRHSYSGEVIRAFTTKEKAEEYANAVFTREFEPYYVEEVTLKDEEVLA